MRKVAKFCYRCGKKIKIKCECDKFDSETGECLKNYFTAKCPDYYAYSCLDGVTRGNGHYFKSWTERVRK